MRTLFALLALLLAAPTLAQDYDAGLLGKPPVLKPDGPATALMLLISGIDGWSAADQATAEALRASGAAVVAVDLPKILGGIEAKDDDCAYLVSGIEALSQQLQRDLKATSYLSPIVAGRAEGGALALAIAAQTPDATIGRTVAVDPAMAVPLKKPLCTVAERTVVAGGAIYALQAGPLPDPVEVILTKAAPEDGRAHAEALKAAFGISVETTSDTVDEALRSHLMDFTGLSTEDRKLADLPMVELEARPAYDAMAIVISGDGGWRDLDKTIAEHFQAKGLPTLGLDALRYFWSRKTPEQTASDISNLIDAYSARWGVRHVALVGYSFGADVMAATVAALPEQDRERIAQISLLGLSEKAGFEISVTGWLGTENADGRPILPDLKKLEPTRVQCFRGKEEDASLCDEAKALGMEEIVTEGGHHFDGDYEALAERILSGLRQRLGLPGAARPVQR